MKLFNWKKANQGAAHLQSITLCTVKITTETGFKSFCEYGYSNRMVIDYAISNPNDWKTVEVKTDCFAVINYVPKAGMGRYVRVYFSDWNPYTAKGLGEKFENAYRNYESVSDFVSCFAPDMLFWLLHQQFGGK